MSEELVKIEIPELPGHWDYEESVKEAKQLFIRWKDITKEMATHFYIAREMLRQHGGDRKSEEYQQGESPVDKDWGDYCQEVSSIEDKDNARRAFNGMLSRFYPRELKESKDSPPLPSDKYRIIYADPPWQYGDKLTEEYGVAEHHYPSMSIEKLCELPIQDLADDNSVLFFWVTSPILPECFEVIESWGFQYKTSFVWDKVQHNYGHYNSVRHEFLLICTRGSCMPDSKKLHDSVVSVERSKKHSEKPEYFRELIDKMYTEGKRIELFARIKADGWDSWGTGV